MNAEAWMTAGLLEAAPEDRQADLARLLDNQTEWNERLGGDPASYVFRRQSIAFCIAAFCAGDFEVAETPTRQASVWLKPFREGMEEAEEFASCRVSAKTVARWLRLRDHLYKGVHAFGWDEDGLYVVFGD